METEKLKSQFLTFLERWWVSILLLPFIIYSLNQIYWALNFNIFSAYNYNYPFPLDIIHIFVDTFLLIVHEAGHTFFSLLGIRFLTILGGSLFQILLPGAILAYCWFNKKNIGLQFSLCLVGYSWLDVAAYAADGGARQLPLIGGLGKESHDWYNILGQLNMLEYDMAIGVIFVITASIFYAGALLYPLFYRDYEEVRLDLEL